LEEHIASIFMLKSLFCLQLPSLAYSLSIEMGAVLFPWNISKYLPDYLPWLHISEDSKDSYGTTMATIAIWNIHFVSGLDPVLPISTFISNGADFKPVFCNIAKN
jgi:hypothetical protein